MAEIKSSLEIALERAAAMGGGDREELDREEGKKRGTAAARKLLSGDLDAPALADELASLAGEGRRAARKVAARILLEAVPQAPSRALAGLRALVGQGQAGQSLQRLSAAVGALQQAELDLDQALAQEAAAELEKAGITGSAVQPNPRAHPAYQQRRQAALAEGLREYNSAAQQLAEALEAE